ncbi:NADPH-dependent F420 reductase [Paeniglutamicibacter antarcticus]|uniref:NAD(P)-binding domain-containing protein n=1 Tax=Paeniglutamicibacter antarcticus TaxID=494023 RepID=A0ABP9TLY7_9MICC
MKIGILGTGSVAQALAGGCAAAGHSVTLGSRHPESRTDLVYPVSGLEETARNAEVIVNATPGASSKELLDQIDAAVFSGKLLIDVANAATSSYELIYPGSSLGEKLQEMLPEANVVKTMNTCAGKIFINPSSLEPTSIFVSGNDASAKNQATTLLKDLGWPEDSIIDLGGISTAKGPEHYFVMWACLTKAMGTTALNVRVVR